MHSYPATQHGANSAQVSAQYDYTAKTQPAGVPCDREFDAIMQRISLIAINIETNIARVGLVADRVSGSELKEAVGATQHPQSNTLIAKMNLLLSAAEAMDYALKGHVDRLERVL